MKQQPKPCRLLLPAALLALAAACGGGSTGGTAVSPSTTPLPPPVTVPATQALVAFTSTEQTMDGFGASDGGLGSIFSGVDGDAKARFLFSTEAAVAYAGGTYPGLGLTMLRIGIQPDGTAETWSNALKALTINPSLTVWASPWSPAAAYKTNLSLHYGTLDPSWFEAWADDLASFARSAQAQGIPLRAISSQNEPDFDLPGAQNTCLYTPEQLVAFTRVLGPKLHALVPPVQLLSPETAWWDHLALYTSALASDGQALGQVDIVATHDYRFQAVPASGLPGKPLWETEVCDVTNSLDPGSMGLSGTSSALTAALWIHDALTTGSANAFHWWWIEQDINSSLHGLLVRGLPPTKLSLVFGNYSRFVRPGYVRLDAVGSLAPNVYLSAYRNATEGTLVVVAINDNAGPAPLDLQLAGERLPSSLVPWVTSVTDDLAMHAAVLPQAGRFPVTLQAQSVTTLVGAP